MNTIFSMSETTTEYILHPQNKYSITKFKKVSSSLEVEAFLRSLYGNSINIYESFYCVFINNANQILGFIKISQGGITQTSVDIRLIFQSALSCLATSIIISHNHPSGNIKPSEADKKITEKIKVGGAVLDIKLLDHIIITADSYFSFAEEYLL